MRGIPRIIATKMDVEHIIQSFPPRVVLKTLEERREELKRRGIGMRWLNQKLKKLREEVKEDE